MGVPKLFRWLVERYPLLLRPADNFPSPSFDNLYLDFNGIIHTCTHKGDDEEETRPKSDKEVIFSIFAYIEVLFNIVKPQKLLMLAIDGVAPRAKMNAQRQRRFKSAHNRLAKNSESDWDSNCITPGTQFMADLMSELKFYVQHKINTDPEWRSIKVVLSGPEVPGEGEHKIAEFIRYQKSLPDYDATTSHCLYGLDADLIMLSLATHEPYFSLLREKVVFRSRRDREFDANRKTEILLQKTDSFQFFSVSLLREYLQLEFQFNGLAIDYNLERVIDDFVFLCFFVGNDFLPSLPFLEIDDGGLASLFAAYKELLPQLKAYLVNAESAKINIEALAQLFVYLGRKEKQIFKTLLEDSTKAKIEKPKIAQVETSLKSLLGLGNSSEVSVTSESKKEEISTENSTVKPTEEKNEKQETDKKEEKIEVKIEEKPKTEENSEKIQSDSTTTDSSKVTKELPEAGPSKISEGTAQQSTEVSFDEFKKNFQFPKFALKSASELTNEFYDKVCHNYLEGLIWNLSYYYQGHLSWKWFYGYHAAPLVQDLLSAKHFSDKFSFDMGSPFSPLQQLLAVLPPHSKDLVPKAYQSLMISPDSPIIEFFPSEFEFLVDPKNREWRNVALVPFIDQDKLLNAFNSVDVSQLTPVEVKRNQFGPNLQFFFTKDKTAFTYQSKVSKGEKAKENFCKCEVLLVGSPEEAATQPSGTAKQRKPFKPIVNPNFDLSSLPIKTFPTLRTLETTSTVSKIGVNIVGTPSRIETRVLQMKKNFFGNFQDLASDYLGRRVFTGYPYHVEAEVSSIFTESQYFYVNQRGRGVTSEVPPSGVTWKDLVDQLKNYYLTFHGIDFVNPIDCIFYVSKFEGMKRTRGSGTFKRFSTTPVPVPLPLIVLNDRVVTHFQKEERFLETMLTLSPKDEFPIGSKVAHIGSVYFGSTGIVKGINKKDSDLFDVEIEVYPSDPQFGHAVSASLKERYFKGGEVATMLKVNPLTIARITGTITFKPGDLDFGLGIKYSSRDLFIPGYAKKVTYNTNKGGKTSFEYSERAVKLLQEYQSNFPALFEGIDKDPKLDNFDLVKILGEDHKEKSEKILQWLSNAPTAKLALLPCESKTLPSDAIITIEQLAEQHSVTMAKKKVKKTVNADPSELFNPMFPIEFGHLHGSKFELGDRVVHVGNTGAVPFGYRGTVITIHNDSCEVLFDEEFLSGTNLHNRCKGLRGGIVNISSLLNLTHPHVVHTSSSSSKKEAKSAKPKQTKTFNPFDALDE